MGNDVERAEFSRRVFNLMSDRDFRKSLEVTADDGSFPIVAALEDDTLIDTLHNVGAAGGRANVVLSFVNGYTVMAISVRDIDRKQELLGTQIIDVSMTMRQFFGHAVSDSSGSYRFKLDDGEKLGSPTGTAHISKVGA